MGLFKKMKQGEPSPQQRAADGAPPPSGDHSVTPDGWPRITIQAAMEPMQILHVTADLAEVGKIELEAKIPHVLGKETKTAMVVRPEGGYPVPVYLNFHPFEEYSADPRLMAHLVRSNDEFRYSPVAMYSVYPIPEYLAYTLLGSTMALFESQLAVLQLQGVPFEEMAERVPPLVKEFFDVDLDFSPGSLDGLDGVMAELHWTDETPLAPFTVLALGAYAGEVFRRRFGGEWGKDDQLSDLPVLKVPVKTPTGETEVTINVVNKVGRQIAHLDGDEVRHLLKKFEEQVEAMAEGKSDSAMGIHVFIPDEWPRKNVATEDEDAEVAKMAAVLEHFNVGAVTTWETFESDLSRHTIPIVVRTEGAPPVPVFVWLYPVQDDEDKGAMFQHVASVRSHDAFRHSRMAYYSRFPMPEEMDYLYSDRPGALFFGQATKLMVMGVPFEDMPGHVTPLLEEFFGGKADFTPDSLTIIDAAVQDLHWKDDPTLFHPVILALTAYLGEVLNRNLGTEWVPESAKHNRPMVHKNRQALDLMGIIAGEIESGGEKGSFVDFYKKVAELPEQGAEGA